MLVFSNLLALALIAADEPRPSTAPTLPAPGEFKSRADELRMMTLREAIRIGLDNSEVVRVITVGVGRGAPVEPVDRPELMIAPVDRDASICNFKSAIMAHVRSIEQQYWSLSEMQIAHWARQTAVKLGEEILARERVELAAGRSTPADVAEAEQKLDQFKLNLVSATSDVITTERQLRNILGLPAADDRRIGPATAPTEAEVDPDWKECLAAMDASQPDMAEKRRLVRVAELKALIEGDNPTLPVERREASRRELEKQQASFEQVRRQSTHALARFFLELDANYKQLQAAQKLRGAAQQRLETQRASHEEGKVTVDRLLDAVNQYANAIAQEAHYKSSYNTSIAALEEAKGTLLASDKITVVEPHARPKADPSAKVDRVAPASFEAPAPAAPRPGARTFNLKARLVPGGLDLDIEVHDGSPATPASP